MTTDTDPTLCSGEYADAPFCAGPSDQGRAPNPCEDAGTCDDGFTDACVEAGLSFDYSNGTCIEATVPVGDTITEAPPLPEAGFDGLLVLVVGIVAIAAGLWIVATGSHR